MTYRSDIDPTFLLHELRCTLEGVWLNIKVSGNEYGLHAPITYFLSSGVDDALGDGRRFLGASSFAVLNEEDGVVMGSSIVDVVLVYPAQSIRFLDFFSLSFTLDNAGVAGADADPGIEAFRSFFSWPALEAPSTQLEDFSHVADALGT